MYVEWSFVNGEWRRLRSLFTIRRSPARSLTSLALFLLITPIIAQRLDDTLRLKEVEVAATRLSTFAAGAKVQRVDSATMARYASADLSDLLANESAVFVKSYGLGSLATTSFRGGSAHHTAVLWNGLAITSPMNGQIDLSLLPVGMANAVSVQYGGSTALWGSGAVGGAIHLDNVPHFNRGLQVDGSVAFGSFNDRRQQLRVELSRHRWITRIALQNSTATNDFTYRTGPPDAPIDRTQTNAATARKGLLFEQHARLGMHHVIGVRYWYQFADREIPPTRVQASSTAYQTDDSHRLMADWKHERGRWSTTVRGGWTAERLDWFAWQDAPDALSRAHQWITEGEVRYRPGGAHTVDIGLHHTHARALADGYPHEPTQDRSAAFALYRFRPRGRFQGSASARQEWLDGRTVPFTGSIGAEFRLRNWAVLKAQGARLYRIPTLNDLYWIPGGNPVLRPEDGYSGDLGLQLHHTWKQFSVRSEITWFNRTMRNWIIWLPGPGFWSPRNILQVWSRGLETDSEVAWRSGANTIKLGVMTNHVVSTNETVTTRYDESVDKQLIYVPMYSGNARLGLVRDRVSLQVSTTYTGYRYTSTDNRDFLDPYWLLNASASYRVVRRARWQADVFLHANNLLNERYEVLQSRPMPLRNYQAGLRFHFDRPNIAKPEKP